MRCHAIANLAVKLLFLHFSVVGRVTPCAPGFALARAAGRGLARRTKTSPKNSDPKPDKRHRGRWQSIASRKRQPPSRRSGALARREGGRAGAVQDASRCLEVASNAGLID